MHEFLAAIGFVVFGGLAMFGGWLLESWIRQHVPSLARYPHQILPIAGLVGAILIVARIVE
jgi:hypothetical protein